MGVTANGKVFAYTENDDYGQCNVQNWENIISVSCSQAHTVGLKADGTVVATGNNYQGKCEVSKWKNIIAVDCSHNATVGLKGDGTVVATGQNSDGQCNVTEWKNIVDIACGYKFTMGLKSDGTVVTTDKEASVSSWEDIVAVSCIFDNPIGVKSDGTVVSIGTYVIREKNEFILINRNDTFKKWKLFNSEEELIIHADKVSDSVKKIRFRSQNVCQYCGGEFKGLIVKKCTGCGKPKDY